MTGQQTIISTILNTVDAVGADMVSKTYQNLVNHYSPVIYGLTTIYIGFCFIKAMRGHLQLNDFTFILIRSVFILTLAMKYDYFCKIIYDVFTNIPLSICKAITINGNNISSQSISSAIDQYLDKGIDMVKEMLSMGGWSNFTYLMFSFILFVFIGLSTGLAVALIVLAKCATIVLLALSPLFIFATLFESTKGLFDGYLRHLITYALIPIMTCSILMILLSVSDIAIQAYHSAGNPTLTNVTPLCITSIIQIYLLSQVTSKCAGLSGGFSLPGFVSALNNLTNKGVSAAGSVANKTANGAMHAAKYLMGKTSNQPQVSSDEMMKQRLKSAGYTPATVINPSKSSLAK